MVLWIIAGETESFSSNSLLALYMQAHPTVDYTVAQNNTYPTGVPAVGIVATLIWAAITDLLDGQRDLVGYWIGITGIVTSAMILGARESTATVFAAYYWSGAVYACQATFFAWANDVMRHRDDALRAVVLASMNMGSNVVNAWWSIVFYGADTAPYFTVSSSSFFLFLFLLLSTMLIMLMQRGMWAMIACSIAMAIWTVGIVYMTARDRKREGAAVIEHAEEGEKPATENQAEIQAESQTTEVHAEQKV